MSKEKNRQLNPGRLLTRNELENFDELMKFDSNKFPVDLPDISKGVENFLKEFREEIVQERRKELKIISKK